jgi:flagellar hook-associated protein 2
MSLALPGVFSQIDTTSLIQATLQAEAVPLNGLTDRQAVYEKKKQAVTDLQTRFGQLFSALGSLDDAAALRTVRGSTGDSGVVTVSTGAGATEGMHNVEVNRLAAAERRVHDGMAAKDSLVGEGTFTYEYDGVQRTILTSADTTLEQLVTMINSDADNPGVNASLLEYADGSGNDWHLVLAGADSGGNYGINIINTDPNHLAAFDDTTFTTTQTAIDAQIRVDGYPAGAWIERSTNSISDVIPGVTLNLQSAGTTSVSLSRSTSNIKQSLQNVVDVYNGIVTAMDKFTGYDEETGKGGILQGDAGVTGLLAQVRSLFVGSVDGFVDGQDTFSLPAQLGMEIDRYGKLSLDTATLDDALTQDYEGVLQLLGAVNSGAAWDANGIQFTSATDDTVAGQYDVKAQFDAGGTLTAAWIKGVGDTDWREATVSGNQIVGASGQAEEDLKLTVQWDGASAEQTGKVRVQTGFAGVAYNKLDELLDEVTGPLSTKQNQYDDAMERIEKNIETQKDRLERKEKQLREKYARLEASLAELDGMRANYQAMFSSLGSGKGLAAMGAAG